MKKKEKQSLQAMTPVELGKVLLDAQTALAIGAMGRYSKQTRNVREARVLRKKIAIISTLVRQKELSV